MRRMSLATKPGLRIVTLIPVGRSSWVIELASARRANLLIEYGDAPGVEIHPETLEMMARLPRLLSSSGSVA